MKNPVITPENFAQYSAKLDLTNVSKSDSFKIFDFYNFLNQCNAIGLETAMQNKGIAAEINKGFELINYLLGLNIIVMNEHMKII
jgi:hypothetical protein